MKAIALRTCDSGTTADLIRLVIDNAQQGATVSEMRARIRVLDALEANTDPDTLRLEDAEHGVLVAALNGFRFARVSKELLQMCDDILEAGQ